MSGSWTGAAAQVRPGSSRRKCSAEQICTSTYYAWKRKVDHHGLDTRAKRLGLIAGHGRL